jgi:dipicolinate synthase subunit B
MAKITNAITDTPVTMAYKAHLRNQKPVVIAISTNDGLGANGSNIGRLINTKNVFIVPFGQDSPNDKPNSLVAKMELLSPTIKEALNGKQIQPILVM